MNTDTRLPENPERRLPGPIYDKKNPPVHSIQLEDVYDTTSIDWTRLDILSIELCRLMARAWFSCKNGHQSRERDILTYTLFRDRLYGVQKQASKATNQTNQSETPTAQEKVQYLRAKREDWLERRRNSTSAVSYNTWLSQLDPAYLR
ncbi:hypothetical protein ScPMuIL_001276 [Solemya velum]